MSEERWDFWEEIGRRLKGVVGYQVQAKKQVFLLCLILSLISKKLFLENGPFQLRTFKDSFLARYVVQGIGARVLGNNVKPENADIECTFGIQQIGGKDFSPPCSVFGYLYSRKIGYPFRSFNEIEQKACSGREQCTNLPWGHSFISTHFVPFLQAFHGQRLRKISGLDTICFISQLQNIYLD